MDLMGGRCLIPWKQPETFSVAAVFDRVSASKFSPEKDPFFSDETLYSKPVVFLKDVLAGERNIKNDDQFTDEEAKEHYEFNLQKIEKRKICGCPLDCIGECCSTRHRRNKCADSCGCLCYNDNVFKYTTMPNPGWGDREDFDWENIGHYRKQVELSDGFDVQVDYAPVPRMSGIIRRMKPLSDMTDVEQDFVKKMAVLAIKRYNRMFSSSSEYRILNVVRVNWRQCGGPTEYLITFVASSAMGSGEPELFQGKVVEYNGFTPGEHPFNRVVLLCRREREVFVDVSLRSSDRIKLRRKLKRRLKRKLDEKENDSRKSARLRISD